MTIKYHNHFLNQQWLSCTIYSSATDEHLILLCILQNLLWQHYILRNYFRHYIATNDCNIFKTTKSSNLEPYGYAGHDVTAHSCRLSKSSTTRALRWLLGTQEFAEADEGRHHTQESNLQRRFYVYYKLRQIDSYMPESPLTDSFLSSNMTRLSHNRQNRDAM